MILQQTAEWLSQTQHWLGDEGIFTRLEETFYYVIISMFVSTAIALPVGIILGYWHKGSLLIINIFNLGRAFPALGVILLCIILIGFNDIPVFIALTALSIPPVLTNTYVGIYHADKQLCDAARAMGMTTLQSLWQLRIPLAMPLIFTGLRTMIVQLIATSTVAAYAGLGGLGRFLVDGLGQNDTPQVIAGAVIVSLLAVGTDVILSLIGKHLLSPYSSPVATTNI